MAVPPSARPAPPRTWLQRTDASVTRFFRRRFRDQLDCGRAKTLARLLTSQHTGDIRFIAGVTALAGVGYLAVGHRAEAVYQLLSLGVFGSILSWCYRTGGQRLGTVDLFACEISALCRVALVVDFANKLAAELCDVASAGPRPADSDPIVLPAAPHSDAVFAGPRMIQERFISGEQYTPVYDTNLKSLEVLDVFVVTAVTEFYTYRKTMMDYMRRALDPDAPAARRRSALFSMSYMLYLMFESARHAVGELIEFEPNREESTINILCSELPLHSMLLARFKVEFKEDYRYDRLRLRVGEYERVVRATCAKTAEACRAARAKDALYGIDRFMRPWRGAESTSMELARRLDAYVTQQAVRDSAPDLTPAAAIADRPSPLPRPPG